jgi:hypothetical protein
MVARGRVLTLAVEGAYVFETELTVSVNGPTGRFEVPHFGFPSLTFPSRFSHVLAFKVEEFVTPVHRPWPTSGPVVLFNRDRQAVVFSPLDHFMDALTAPLEGEWRCGLGGLIERVPAGTTQRVLVVSGEGITRTFLKWGELIQAWWGHRPVDPYADVAMSRLGYWTDNGSYYYYRTEPGMNYAETLLAVKKYADESGIPYGYFQIDSWWYPKAEIKERSSHNRGGTLVWEPIPELFPEGLPAFQAALGLPLVAHNRYFSKDSPYCQRYECVPDHGGRKQGAHPIDPRVWDEIMSHAVSYGVEVYEQDWLFTHLELFPWLRQGMGRAASWYDALAGAAEERGLTMQLCMASPEFFLQQLKHNNVTHARASHDYKGGLAKSFFWVPFHEVSLFAASVGIWPFKDNFQTTIGQRATYMLIPEASPWEEALISSLSGGPVGPSDRIGHSDRELIMHTCRQDGVLLKPDRPATPLDVMFLDNDNMLLGGNKPWIISTLSDHDLGRVLYLAAFGLALQATRDNQRRMRAIGFDVRAVKVMAYFLAGLIAGVAGVLYVWFNGRISPGTVSVAETIGILVIAVIGGLRHPVGPFLGAAIYVLLKTFAIDLIGAARFNTLIGLVFLVIVFVSPDGVLGLWERLKPHLAPKSLRSP